MGGGWSKLCLIPLGVLWGKQERGVSTTQLRGKQKGHPSQAGTSTPSAKKLLTSSSHTTQYLSFPPPLQDHPYLTQATSSQGTELLQAESPRYTEHLRASGITPGAYLSLHLALTAILRVGYYSCHPSSEHEESEAEALNDLRTITWGWDLACSLRLCPSNREPAQPWEGSSWLAHSRSLLRWHTLELCCAMGTRRPGPPARRPVSEFPWHSGSLE